MNHEWDNRKLYHREEKGIDSGKENLWQQIVQEKEYLGKYSKEKMLKRTLPITPLIL